MGSYAELLLSVSERTLPGAASVAALAEQHRGALVGLGVDEPAALTDTLRLDRLPAMTLDVTDGSVHLALLSSGTMRVGAKVTGSPTTRFAAMGRRITV